MQKEISIKVNLKSPIISPVTGSRLKQPKRVKVEYKNLTWTVFDRENGVFNSIDR